MEVTLSQVDVEKREQRKDHDNRRRIGQAQGHRPEKIIHRVRLRTLFLNLAERVDEQHPGAHQQDDQSADEVDQGLVLIDEGLGQSQEEHGDDRIKRVGHGGSHGGQISPSLSLAQGFL